MIPPYPQKRATLIILRNPIFQKATGGIDFIEKIRADNCDFTHDYRLCVFASGSLIIDVFSCRTAIRVSCLHFGQNSGKFSSTVSSRTRSRVLLSQTGHNIHFSSIIVHHPLFCPKCKQESLVNVKQLNMSIIKEPDA